METVYHPINREKEAILTLGCGFAVFAVLFGVVAMDFSPILTAVLATVGLVVIGGGLLFAIVHVTNKAKAESNRVTALLHVDTADVELLKKLDVPCTVHWVRQRGYVEFSDFDDEALFKLARRPRRNSPFFFDKPEMK